MRPDIPNTSLIGSVSSLLNATIGLIGDGGDAGRRKPGAWTDQLRNVRDVGNARLYLPGAHEFRPATTEPRNTADPVGTFGVLDRADIRACVTAFASGNP